MATHDETEIRGLLEEWADAMRRKDANAIIARQTDDIVQFSLAAPLRITGPNKAGLQQWLNTWEGGLIYQIAELDIHSSADTAWCTCYTQLGGKKVGGEGERFWMRQTFGLRRTGGNWKIAHRHDSVPFSMDGEPVALFDLQP